MGKKKKINSKKTPPPKKAEIKDRDTNKSTSDNSDYGGLPDLNLKKNLGCG